MLKLKSFFSKLEQKDLKKSQKSENEDIYNSYCVYEPNVV